MTTSIVETSPGSIEVLDAQTADMVVVDRRRVALRTIQSAEVLAGPRGLSAYEIWLSQGNAGTQADYLDSLRGPTGPAGESVPGPAGPPGPPGPAGPAGEPYYQAFDIATPATTWVLEHNQNTYGLNVETLDNNRSVIEGNIRFVDPNRIEVDWYYPTAGQARVFR